jgi:hypothetical protein
VDATQKQPFSEDEAEDEAFDRGGIDDLLDDDAILRNIPAEEIHLIEDFLDKFVFVTDSDTSREQLDLGLALKALPLRVNEFNIYRVDLMGFNLAQRSLIAF